MIKVPSPSFAPLVKMVDTDLFKDIDSMPQTLSIGVGVFGPAAAYAIVWELGSKRIKTPGPKTMWGTNRLGIKRVFSKQAPKGYVYINAKKAHKIFEAAIQSVDFDLSDIETSKIKLEVAMDNAAQEIAGIMRQSAPVDTGTLRVGLQPIYTDEESLLDTTQTYTLFI